MLINSESTKTVAATKAGMDPKTALKYRSLGQLPSQLKQPHAWRTRPNPFAGEWDKIKDLLLNNPGLEAKTIFEYLQRTHDGKYQDGQLRTLQRHIKQWRALEGEPREVFFPQIHYPGDLSASDFTHMSSLGITIQGELFKHLLYHFVLTYANWENVEVCYSESFESLSEGLQASFWKLGGVPKKHRTDRLSAAVNNDCNLEKFTPRYRALLKHYGVEPERINAGSGNENGDVEQSHHRFKGAVEQALLLRGNRDFKDLESYKVFLESLLKQRNSGRSERFKEELAVLRRLPDKRLGNHTPLEKTVSSSSTVRVLDNAYSVHSRLIGEKVQIRIHVSHLEVWYAQRMVDRIPRLGGRGSHKINYRHIIDWLVRKPGAFANYKYRSDMFPTSHFRMAYDALKRQNPLQADKGYLRLLKISSLEGESVTEQAIRVLLSQKTDFSIQGIEDTLRSESGTPQAKDVHVDEVDLGIYDALLGSSTEVVRS